MYGVNALPFRVKKQIYAASFGIASILFLWGIQIHFGSVGVPVYFFLSVFILGITKFTHADVVRLMGGIAFLLILTGIQKMQGVEFVTPLRTFISILVLPFLIACIYRWITLILKSDCMLFFRTLRFFLMLQLAVQVGQLLMCFLALYSTPYVSYFIDIPRVSGFFNEPSHVALSLSPFIFLFICYNRQAMKWLGRSGLITLLLIFFLSHSATLIVAIAMAFFFKTIRSIKSFRQTVRFIPYLLVSGIIIYMTIIQNPAINDRIGTILNIVLSGAELQSSMNLSSLVFIKGAQMAWAGLQHDPVGVGILNFQILNDYSTVSLLSNTLYTLNSDDGGSIAFKLIGEFGYLGLLMVLLVFIMCSNSVRHSDIKNILLGFMLFGMVVSFSRGASYYDGVPIIAFAVMLIKMRAWIARIHLPKSRSLNYYSIPQPESTHLK